MVKPRDISVKKRPKIGEPGGLNLQSLVSATDIDNYLLKDPKKGGSILNELIDF